MTVPRTVPLFQGHRPKPWEAALFTVIITSIRPNIPATRRTDCDAAGRIETA